jgi:hypothetical protein
MKDMTAAEGTTGAGKEVGVAETGTEKEVAVAETGAAATKNDIRNEGEREGTA